MKKDYPLEFTLEDGTHVEVNKTGSNTYDFTLQPEKGPVRHFTFVDDEKFTAEVEKTLDFDQLNALRRFWLESEKIG